MFTHQHEPYRCGVGLMARHSERAAIQQVGNKKVVYYKATFELTDIETTEIVWTDHKEITKHFKKKSIGF